MGNFSNNDVTPSPFLWALFDAGPTLGKVRRPVYPSRIVTASETLGLYDFQLLIKPSPAANLTITLPTARSWLNAGGGGFPILIQDQMQCGTNSKTITLTPGGSDTINGQASWSIASDYASVVLRPFPDATGWSAQ